MQNVFSKHIIDSSFNTTINDKIKIFNINIFYDEMISDIDALENILTTTQRKRLLEN